MLLETTVVGCGAVAQRLYRKPLQQLEKRAILRVTALVDPVLAHARTLGAFFPKAAHYQDLDDSLARTRPSLTLVLSPAHLHADQAIAALRQNSHVLCEKPMASTAADCTRMDTVAAASKRVLAVGMIRRFFPAFAQLRDLIARGRLGQLTAFDYREGHKFEWEVTTPAAFQPRARGGTGVLFDIGPHVIDHLGWTFGDLEVRAYADDALGGIESNLAMDVAAPDVPGAIHLSWDTPLSNELRVQGSKAAAVLRIDQFDQLAINDGAGYVPQAITSTFPGDLGATPQSFLSPTSYPQAIYCQLVQTARAIALGEAPAVDGESGRRCVAVLETALARARPLDAPWLEPAEQEASARLHWTNAR